MLSNVLLWTGSKGPFYVSLNVDRRIYFYVCGIFIVNVDPKGQTQCRKHYLLLWYPINFIKRIKLKMNDLAKCSQKNNVSRIFLINLCSSSILHAEDDWIWCMRYQEKSRRFEWYFYREACIFNTIKLTTYIIKIIKTIDSNSVVKFLSSSYLAIWPLWDHPALLCANVEQRGRERCNNLHLLLYAVFGSLSYLYKRHNVIL